MAEICLHNTYSGALEALKPRSRGRVGIYACGPTVYSRIHVGNARPYVVFSLLKRYLEYRGHEVTLVINITDVNDKIYEAANRAGVPSGELAARMTALYRTDTDGLGLGRPDHEPLASATIGPIIDHIQALMDGGSAYEAGGDVYFSVRSDPDYGQLSHRRPEDMDQGEGVEGAARKRDALDFALWKSHKPEEDTWWDSPWGRGRPGWHIECSAMAESLLGVSFDIHGGGIDLLFPHHENEAAQTRCARGQELARLWVHNGMLQTAGEKMAKSVGNIAPLHEVLAEHGRDTLIMYLCSGHYRQPIAFGPDSLAEADQKCQRLREVGRTLTDGPSDRALEPLRTAFFDALARDFNTPRALAAMWDWVRESNRRGGTGRAHLVEMLNVLGLDTLLAPDRSAPDGRALKLLQARQRARAEGDYAQADRLRDELFSAGWTVRDTPSGPELVRIG